MVFSHVLMLSLTRYRNDYLTFKKSIFNYTFDFIYMVERTQTGVEKSPWRRMEREFPGSIPSMLSSPRALVQSLVGELKSWKSTNGERYFIFRKSVYGLIFREFLLRKQTGMLQSQCITFLYIHIGLLSLKSIQLNDTKALICFHWKT